MMKLRINPEVIEDIAEIKQYIREELCNPTAADRIAKRIVSAYKGLKTAPFIGAPLDSVLEVKTDYRFLVCGNYLIFYKVKDDVISIYRVMNGRRDYCRQLFGMSYTQIADDEEVSAVFSVPHEYNLWSWVVGKATSQRTAKPCKIKTKYHMLVWLSCVE